ncbi:MAG: LamG-like jellyroll fold domain-containing protein [Thermoguttaceae bacterium]
MIRSILSWGLVLWLLALGRAHAQAPLLYLPWDGSPQAAISAGQAGPRSSDSGFSYGPGVRGTSIDLQSDLRWAAAGCFDARRGTVAVWVRPAWRGNDPTSHYLFCIYGSPKLKEPWLANRFSLWAAGSHLTFMVYGAEPNEQFAIRTPIQDWEPGKWHHVAATWENVNSKKADAALCLYVDGRLAAERSGVRLDIGPMSDVFDIGRDSDLSPGHANAQLDEFYIYGRALTAAEIRRAVELASDGVPPATVPASPGSWRADWWNDAWPLRCRVRLPEDAPARSSGNRVPLRLRRDFQADLAALGIFGQVIPESIRVVPCNPQTGACGRGAEPLPMVVEPDAIAWQMPGGALPGKRPDFHVYFDAAELDTSIPLYVRAGGRAWKPPAAAALAVPDYARDSYGSAWDFDKGDFEGIDAWGNKPEYVRNRRVKGGVLSMDVKQDPYFIWGDMWSSGQKTNRKVSIDLKKYPILKMRIRQSCPSAPWKLYGRAGSPDLMAYEFRVTGTGWQAVRIDLVEEAHWSGVLDAFRINTTYGIADAHIEIDWISLTNEVLANHDPVEVLGRASTTVQRLVVETERRRAECGSHQAVTVRAQDRQGAPIGAQPVTVRLAAAGDGRLTARSPYRTLALSPTVCRGLTDAQGRLQVELISSGRMGREADIIEAAADFSPVRSERVAVDMYPGPPHHYEISPSRATCLKTSQFPLPFRVQVADAHGNPVAAEGRRVTLSVPPEATVQPPMVVTDAAGLAAAALRIDPARRWVYSIAARDTLGLSGVSGKITVALEGDRPGSIRLLPNGYFATADGRPFVPLGGFYANWVQLETADGEWATLKSFTDTSDKEKRRWMKFLHDSGATVMRFMLRTHRAGGMEPMDLGGRVNQSLLAEAMRYLDLAREFDLKFQLVLHEDYGKPVYVDREALEHFTLPAFAGEDRTRLPPEQARFIRDRRLAAPVAAKYTDPDAIACQDRYVRELIPALRANPQVFAYELENEMVDCPASWAQHAIETIRNVDKATPVCVSHGGGGLSTADPLWWHRRTPIGLYNYHLYPQGGTTAADLDYGAAVDVLSRYGRMSGPSMLGESSGDQFRLHPNVQTRRWVMRDIIWMALTKGSPGVFFWNARGPEVREFKLARDAMAQLDLATFRRARPAVGIDVRHAIDNDKWFRTVAGTRVYVMMGRYAQHYLSEGVDFDFTFEPEKYEKSSTLAQFAPPEPPRRCFRFGKGWQLSYLARKDWGEALVYVRNFAGIEPWTCEMDHSPWTQYLRTRRRAPLHLALDLPAGSYRATIYDLDRQRSITRDVDPSGSIDLGTTDHDFAIVLKN